MTLALHPSIICYILWVKHKDLAEGDIFSSRGNILILPGMTGENHVRRRRALY